jgi:hypothetical protein
MPCMLSLTFGLGEGLLPCRRIQHLLQVVIRKNMRLGKAGGHHVSDGSTIAFADLTNAQCGFFVRDGCDGKVADVVSLRRHRKIRSLVAM